MSAKNPKYEYKGLTCSGCGCVFDSKARNKLQKYCTKRCRGIHVDAGARFKSGISSWNAGTNVSGMSGKAHSRETKNLMRAAHLGEKSANWQGGLRGINYGIRRSKKYADWRTSVFVRDDYTCQFCGDKSVAGNRVRLEADHIKQFAYHVDLRFDVENGRTLCKPCHRKTDTWGKSITGKEAVLESTGETYNSMFAKRGQ